MVWGKLSDKTLCPGGPAFLTSPCHAWILPEDDYQRVPQPRTPTQDQQWVAQSNEQRVGPTPTKTTLDDLLRMLDAPPIMNAPNPTAKWALKSTKRVHQRLIHNNVPNTVPPIKRTLPWRPLPPATEALHGWARLPNASTTQGSQRGSLKSGSSQSQADYVTTI